MRGFLPAAVVVALVAVAPVVAAGGGGGGGPNGGWGGGLLSESLSFDCDTSTSTGFMKWSPDLANLVFDFHGYELEQEVVYHLICFEGDASAEPAELVELGAKWTCIIVEDCYGVHIKGEVPWPGLTDATVCLVPDSYWQFGGIDGWAPEEYLVSVGTADL